MVPKKSLDEITPEDDGSEVRVQGFVEDVRKLGGIAFVILRQKAGTLQLAFPKKKVPELMKAVGSVTRESVLEATGTVAANKQARNGWEIVPSAFQVLAAAALEFARIAAITTMLSFSAMPIKPNVPM